jgi:hypothetical protein
MSGIDPTATTSAIAQHVIAAVLDERMTSLNRAAENMRTGRFHRGGVESAEWEKVLRNPSLCTAFFMR